MNRIDKLLLLARTNAKYSHSLICVIIPEFESNYMLKITLQKQSEIVESCNEYFSNKEQCESYITEYCNCHGLTENNTLLLILNVSAAENEVQ